MENALWYTVVAILVVYILERSMFVESIGVEGVIANNVVLEQSGEVFLAVLAEKEGIDPWAEALKGEVGRCEKGATDVGGGFIEVIYEARLDETELEGAELAGEEGNNVSGYRGWEENAIKSVNDAVRAEDIDGDDAGVEIDSQAPKGNLRTKALRRAS